MSKVSTRSICTSQRNGGEFCERESLPGAPFPICLKHAAMLMEFLEDVMPRDHEDRVIVAWRALENRRHSETERKRIRPACDVVYYVRVGQHIKIGYSADLPKRMRAYPPDSQLLGYELGGKSMEAQRHTQFADELSMGREWFKPSPRLLDHIKSVNVRRQAAS